LNYFFIASSWQLAVLLVLLLILVHWMHLSAPTNVLKLAKLESWLQGFTPPDSVVTVVSNLLLPGVRFYHLSMSCKSCKAAANAMLQGFIPFVDSAELACGALTAQR